MLLSAVSVLVVAQSSSEFPEGLMNKPVLVFRFMKTYAFYGMCILFVALCIAFVMTNPISKGFG